MIISAPRCGCAQKEGLTVNTQGKAPLTYCNPIPVENMPEGRWLDASMTRVPLRSLTDYRSISDPSVIFWDGKWVLYPSYGVAWVSENFVDWKFVDIGVRDMTYSPAVAHFRGKWYLTGHTVPDMYVADSPLGPFVPCGKLTDANGSRITATDCCLMADGDRLFIYWVSLDPPAPGEDIELVTGTIGAELDPDEPWKMITEPVLINRFDPDMEWQRHGEYNQNKRMGWIEGQWAFKIGSRYYLLYSGSGTQFSGYCNAVLVSDEGPLSGFRMQKNHNPLTLKRHGFVRGAGHGCVTPGPGGTLWCFYTCVFGFNHQFERRIAMDPLGIDENGELYCPACTDMPQYAPGVKARPELGNGTGWVHLCAGTRPEATSHAAGREPLYAVDESVLSWWQPAAGDTAPAITVTFSHSTAYRLRALRLVWRDIGMEILDGVMPGPFRYAVEYASDPECKEWRTLADASENTRDLPVDYREFPEVAGYAVRLRILGAPAGITPGLTDFAVFGNYD